MRCHQERNQCKYLQMQKGFTNLNQKEAKMVYSCGRGIFNITRVENDLPISCKSFVGKDLRIQEK